MRHPGRQGKPTRPHSASTVVIVSAIVIGRLQRPLVLAHVCGAEHDGRVIILWSRRGGARQWQQQQQGVGHPSPPPGEVLPGLLAV